MSVCKKMVGSVDMIGIDITVSSSDIRGQTAFSVGIICITITGSRVVAAGCELKICNQQSSGNRFRTAAEFAVNRTVCNIGLIVILPSSVSSQMSHGCPACPVALSRNIGTVSFVAGAGHEFPVPGLTAP